MKKTKKALIKLHLIRAFCKKEPAAFYSPKQYNFIAVPSTLKTKNI